MLANAVRDTETVEKVTPEKKDPKFWNTYLIQVGESQNRAAFKVIYEHFGPLIKSYFISKYPNNQSIQMIDELVQEVMIKVWNKSKSFDPSKAAASTWIFTLARNARIDMLRRQNKYANTTSIETEEVWEDTTDLGPHAYLQHSRNAKNISHSLTGLPPEQALIIKKVYMESKSHSEVADELKLPLGTVKSRVRLALSKLKHLVQH